MRSPAASQKQKGDRQSEEINQGGAQAAAAKGAEKQSFFTWHKSKHTWEKRSAADYFSSGEGEVRHEEILTFRERSASMLQWRDQLWFGREGA